MDLAILIIRILLAAIFLVAAMAKLASFEEAKTSMKQFGVPTSVTPVFLSGLIFLEALIGFLFVPTASSKYAAGAAFVLLLIFTGTLARVISKGIEADCQCFGSVSAKPVGATEIIRNILIAGLTLIVVLTPATGYSIVGGTKPADAIDILAAGLIYGLFGISIAMVFLLADLRKTNAELSDRLAWIEKGGRFSKLTATVASDENGFPIGTPAPVFDLETGDGETRGSRDIVGNELPLLLLFVGPTCVPCQSVIESIQKWRESLGGRIRLLVVTSGSLAENESKFGKRATPEFLYQKDNSVSGKFFADWTPSAVLIGSDGRIASRTVVGDKEIYALVDRLSESDGLTRPLWIETGKHKKGPGFGKTVDEFELSYLNGSKFKSSDLLDKESIVLFWSLSCSYCIEMVSEIREWFDGSHDYDFFLFADGEKDELKASGLEDVIIHDSDYVVSRKLGMRGTPSAIRIDSNGVIVSETASGAEKIRLLASREQTETNEQSS